MISHHQTVTAQLEDLVSLAPVIDAKQTKEGFLTDVWPPNSPISMINAERLTNSIGRARYRHVDTSALYRRHQLTSALLRHQLNNPPPTVERGEGVWLWDTEGRDYIDGSSEAMTENIGHGVAKIADVMRDQAQTIGFSMYAQFSNAPAEALAKRLAALAPADIDHIFCVNSGSEAAEYAMRLALQVFKECSQPAKTKMLSRDTSDHGMTMGALSLSGQDARRADFGNYLHAFPAVPAAYAYRSDWGDLPEDEQWVAADDWEKAILAAGPDKVAAIIAEPIVGAAGGALVAPKGYFRRLREICDQYDVLMIMDEVITGIGRTGSWFASEAEGVVPDIITTAKGLSAGYAPLGAVLVRAPLIDAIKKGSGLTPYGHTFSCNPIGAAVCMAVLDHIEDNEVLANVAARGAELEDGLKALAQRYRHMADVRGRGLLWGFEFVLDRKDRTPPLASFNASGVFVDLCKEAALIVYPAGIAPYNNATLIAPPLVISKNEVEALLQRLDKGLAQMENQLNDLAAA